jgi:hypothetical protein
MNYIANITYITLAGRAGRPVRSQLGRQEVVMFTNKTKVLLIFTQGVLDRARVLAGKATTALTLPVSLPIVLRALIEAGLKRDNHPALLVKVEGQAQAGRHQRSVAGRAGLRGN